MNETCITISKIRLAKGHDWFHRKKVYKKCIAPNEVCDTTVLKLAALLHDIADSKFNNGDESIGLKLPEHS
jgi:uncharacterized protein